MMNETDRLIINSNITALNIFFGLFGFQIELIKEKGDYMDSIEQVLCEHDWRKKKHCLVCCKCNKVMHQKVADIILDIAKEK